MKKIQKATDREGQRQRNRPLSSCLWLLRFNSGGPSPLRGYLDDCF